MIVLAIGLDPFSQQLLQLQPGTLFVKRPLLKPPLGNGDGVSTPRATYYWKGEVVTFNNASQYVPLDELATKVEAKLELSMQAAILNGLSRLQQSVEQQLAVNCPTGTCTWPQFQTLGVCKRCNDLTSDLKRVDNFGRVYNAIYSSHYENAYRKQDGTAFALPNGHFIVNINGCWILDGVCTYDSPTIGQTGVTAVRMTSFGTSEPRATNTMQDLNTLIWAMSIIHVDTETVQSSGKPEYQYTWPSVPLRATECGLYYCAKTIDSNMTANSIYENITEATGLKRDTNCSPSDIPTNDETNYWLNAGQNLCLRSPNDTNEPEYEVKGNTVWALSHYLRQLLSTNITGNSSIVTAISEVLHNGSVGYNGALHTDKGIPPVVSSVWNPSNVDIPDTFGLLATSITNEFRNNDFNGDFVNGYQGDATKFYRAAWGWIVLHAVVLVGGALFWLVTLWSSSNFSRAVPTWKNSALAVMSQGAVTGELLKGAGLVKEMEDRARKERVKMPLGNEDILLQTRGGSDNDV